MAPLILEGRTLGSRHKHYNTLVKEAIANSKTLELATINFEDNDIDNLFKIDIASKTKNVEYIIEVLKSEDMLYVSRAIKQCTWLITDQQYAHIINPEYLHSQLFPHMTSKAINKLMLHVRLHLRDKSRVEKFYNYYKGINLETALKWLPHCSVPFTEDIVKNNIDIIDIRLLKILCKKSITILEIFIQNCNFNTQRFLKATKFLLYSHTDKYIDILESIKSYQIPCLNKNDTDIIMKKCPDRILNNFQRYSDNIHVQTFVKHLKQEGAKDFLLKQVINKKLEHWFTFEHVKHFIERMPDREKFEFVKYVFIDKIHKKEGFQNFPEDSEQYKISVLYSTVTQVEQQLANVYPWYSFAPFDVAFMDLKKFISSELSVDERISMLSVLITSAGHNLQRIHSVLEYYRDKHINEPFKFKNQFVNKVLSQTVTHRYDDKTWNILNEIFHSMEVYTETNNNVQPCIQSIIIYKVLHGEDVPEIIKTKFVFYTLKKYKRTLNNDEKELIFKYLLASVKSNINHKVISNEADFNELMETLCKTLDLLIDWDKEILDVPWLLDEIKKLIQMKRNRYKHANLAILYNKKKTWRKHLFEESIILCPTEEACVNALKHDPGVLSRYKGEVEALCLNDAMSLRRLLSKLRVYWPQSLADEWTAMYRARLQQPGGHKSLVQGLCTLLPKQQLLDFIQQYAPVETKINWSETDKQMLSLQKQIARNMYCARPQPSPDAVLWYAKGDYLQYTLSSLNAIFYNMSTLSSHEHIPKLLKAPVSLQKHGIRFAFSKLKAEEARQLFYDVWKSTKNASIRAILFKQTHNLLCKEDDSSSVDELWKLLDMFIDNLSSDEDKTIYKTLAKVSGVPVRVMDKFCMKSYTFLKSLPPKTNSDTYIQKIVDIMECLMKYLDPDFVSDVIQEFIDNKYIKQRNTYHDMFSTMSTVTSYFLCTEDESIQIQRYNKQLYPLIESSLSLWNAIQSETYYIRQNFNDLLRSFANDFQKYVLVEEIVSPITLFTNIQKTIEKTLLIEENYILLRSWKLTVTLVTIVHKYRFEKKNNDSNYVGELVEMYLKAAPEFGEHCSQYVEEDAKLYFPSVYILFCDALKWVFDVFRLEKIVQNKILKSMLGCTDVVQSNLTVLELIPKCVFKEEEKTELRKISKIIASHPSPEVKMHYYKKFSDIPALFHFNINNDTKRQPFFSQMLWNQQI